MRRVVALAWLCVLGALGLMWWGFAVSPRAPKAPAPPRALLLVEDDTGTYPMQLRKGLQEALQERGSSLRSERLGDVVTGDPALYQEVDLVYLLCAQPQRALSAMADAHPPVVVIGQETAGHVCVLADQEDGGWQAGLHLALTRPAKPVLLVGDELRPLQAQRLRGALRGLGDYSAQVLPLAQALQADLGDFSAVLALSGEATQALADLPGAIPPLYGFDAPGEQVALLESGRLQGMVADNPYALGYLAGSMVDLARREDQTPFLRLGPMRLVTPDTLYDAENVKLMFPLLQ